MRTSVFFILFLFCICNHIKSQATELPDSVLTIQHVNYFVISDPEKSQQILDELVGRKQYKEWELKKTQADLYHYTGKYKMALNTYEQVEQYDEVKNDPEAYMRLLSRITESYLLNNDLKKSMEKALELVEVAQKLNNEGEIGRAYMMMGNVMYYEENFELSQEYMEKAEKHLEKSQNHSYIYHFYLTMANLTDKFKQHEWIHDYIKKAEENLLLMGTREDISEEKIAYEKGRLYALASEILIKAGREKEAENYYKEFMKSPSATNILSKFHIIPYLLEIKDYKTIIDISLEKMEFLKAENDTLGIDMAGILHYLIEAYEKLGEKDKALFYAKQAVAVRRRMQQKESEKAAVELATVFNVKQKELLILKQENALKTRNLLLTGSFIIIILSIVGILLIIQNLRRTRKRNRAMISQIKEMQAYREELEKIRQKEITEDNKQQLPDTENVSSDETRIHKIFVLADQKIRNEKLYLNPALVRDDIIKLLPVSKTDFIQAINVHTAGSFTDYINNMRMEVALKMLEESPELSIEGISEESGFGSVRNFYRLFKQKYDMSPNEYRKLVK